MADNNGSPYRICRFNIFFVNLSEKVFLKRCVIVFLLAMFFLMFILESSPYQANTLPFSDLRSIFLTRIE